MYLQGYMYPSLGTPVLYLIWPKVCRQRVINNESWTWHFSAMFPSHIRRIMTFNLMSVKPRSMKLEIYSNNFELCTRKVFTLTILVILVSWKVVNIPLIHTEKDIRYCENHMQLVCVENGRNVSLSFWMFFGELIKMFIIYSVSLRAEKRQHNK